MSFVFRQHTIHFSKKGSFDRPEAGAHRTVEEEWGRNATAHASTSCQKLGPLEAMWCKAFDHHILPWIRPSYFVIHLIQRYEPTRPL